MTESQTSIRKTVVDRELHSGIQDLVTVEIDITLR